MEIIVAKRAGFCFGVKRAVDIAFEVADRKSRPAVTLGPIIHNPQVIERLAEKGIAPVTAAPRKRSTVIIRTHGVEQQVHDDLNRSGHELIDATCPFVKKAQHYARLLADDGYQVLILGDADHPEVRSILSYAGRDATVVPDPDRPPKLKARVGIVVQTTQPVEKLKRLINRTMEKTKELKVYNTICSSTALRLKETESLARSVDLMLVVGGKNSANTTQLTRLCKALGVRTHHIETAREIRKQWLRGADRVGVTAGASTPDWIIGDVTARLRALGGQGAHGF